MVLGYGVAVEESIRTELGCVQDVLVEDDSAGTEGDPGSASQLVHASGGSIDMTYAMYTAGWKDGASGAGFCASGLTVGSTGRAVSREASTEDLIFSSDMAASGG